MGPKKQVRVFTRSLTIPANASSTISMPEKNAAGVTGSGKPGAQLEGVRFLRMENKAAVYPVLRHVSVSSHTC